MDTSWVIRKFYAAANAINCHTKSVQELSRLYLLEAFTLPILTYGCDGIFVSCSNLRKMNVWLNNVYRKVFLIFIFENRLNVFSYSVADWILCILMYFVNLNFIMVYIEPITPL